MVEALVLIGLTLAACAGWLINFLGMPGNWLVVALGAGCWWLAGPDDRAFVGLGSLIAMVVVSLIGEALEFLASAMGASRMGGSKRGTALALVGSIGGALFGLLGGVVIPVPIVGPVIASLLLGATGAFAGAIAGERWAGKEWDESIQIGGGAFWGRLLGTVAKAICGTLALGIFLIALWL